MTESGSKQNIIALSKLEKIIEQFSVALTEDYPYEDTKLALKALRAQAEKLRSQANDFSLFSKPTEQQFCFRINYFLEASSQILGILTRSGTMRNAFEVYEPFKSICKKFIPHDAHLIISSEWNYTPFTFPMNLQELPEFIIIGLPASESNNALIFPSAAHELGHSIWLVEGIQETFSDTVQSSANIYINNNPNLLNFLTPEIDEESIETDMFAQQIRQQFLFDCTSACLRQIEELFCDFIALKIFGRSYLHAFQYLIAPGDGGNRSVEYPSVKDRATVLNLYAQKDGQQIENYEAEFQESNSERVQSYDSLVSRVADNVRSEHAEKAYERAVSLFESAGLDPLSEEKVAKSKSYLINGMPITFETSFGDLYSAAWEFFLDSYDSGDAGDAGDAGGIKKLNYVSELVLKSVESWEFSRKFQC